MMQMQQLILPTNRQHATWRHLATLFVAVLLTCLSRPADVTALEQAWEFSPYKVQIWLATETAGELNARVRESLVFALSQRIEAIMGAPWDAEIIEPPADLRASMLIDPALVTTETLEQLAPESLNSDKIILLTVHVNPREFQIDARELDCRTRLFGASVGRIVRQPDLLEIACCDAVADAFRAVTRLEIGEPKSAIVRIRAGGLVLDRESPCFVGLDDVLLPIQRNNDRAGLPTRIIPIEWTFLQVQAPDETNPYVMTCRIWSGKPNPLTGKNTPRKERYALKVKPVTDTTTLRVLSRVVVRGEEPYPMPGLEVYAKTPEPDPPAPASSQAGPNGSDSKEASATAGEADKTQQPDAAAASTATKPEAPKVKGDAAELIGRTDWNGTLEVGQGETLLRIVYLKNGGQLLARLPMVPGLEPLLIASVPDDALRLEAEGFIKGVQGQLMDLEAQRQILKARFMMRIEKGELDEAQKLLEEIKQLPTRNDLVREIDRQQNQQVESPIKSVQARIDEQLYGKTREALGKYLSPSLVNELTSVLNNARRKQPANATAAALAK